MVEMQDPQSTSSDSNVVLIDRIDPSNNERLFRTRVGVKDCPLASELLPGIAVALMGDEAMRPGMRFSAVGYLSHHYPTTSIRLLQYRENEVDVTDIYVLSELNGKVLSALLNIGKVVSVTQEEFLPPKGMWGQNCIPICRLKVNEPLSGAMMSAISNAIDSDSPDAIPTVIVIPSRRGNDATVEQVPTLPGVNVTTMDEMVQRELQRIETISPTIDGLAKIHECLRIVDPSGLCFGDRSAFLDVLEDMNFKERSLAIAFRDVCKDDLNVFINNVLTRDASFVSAINHIGGLEGDNAVVQGGALVAKE